MADRTIWISLQSEVRPVPFIQFLRKAQNELEKGGRQMASAAGIENEATQQCPNCHRSMPISEIWDNFNVCACGHHFRMNARQRIRFLCDPDTFEEFDRELTCPDRLNFPGYADRLASARNACGEREAVVCGRCAIQGASCCLFVMEPGFMMGSMGQAVGEKITRLFEYATMHGMSVVGFTVSGGARMQEGILSLMQMAKTSGAVRKHADAGLFYLTVLTDPTTGGVTASFAMEGDVILAEPGAMVGFAGTRVIEQSAHKKLPQGFQRAEFLLEHGFVDSIVARKNQRRVLSYLLEMHKKEESGDGKNGL